MPQDSQDYFRAFHNVGFARFINRFRPIHKIRKLGVSKAIMAETGPSLRFA
jgi:hypothetical protein